MRYDKKKLFAIVVLGVVILCLVICQQITAKERGNNWCDSNFCKDSNRILSRHLEVSTTNNTSASKLMIVAHPDDETLWGSHALYKEKYLVVCVTCGVNKRRVKEFEKVMDATGDDYIMLGYPDLVNGKKSKWTKEYPYVEQDLKDIIDAKNWDLVVTHNPEGEYGHIHHRMINRMVTDNSDHSKLTYFGHFYWRTIEEEDNLYRLTADEYAFKKNILLPIYVTQIGAIRNLVNMEHYESWITYSEWYGDIDEEN